MVNVMKTTFIGKAKYISAPDKVVRDAINHCVMNTGEEFHIGKGMKTLEIFLLNPILECLVYEELLRRGYEELLLADKDAA